MLRTVLRTVRRPLSRAAALGLVAAATASIAVSMVASVPAPAKDLAEVPTATLLSRAETLLPVEMYLLAARLFAEGRREEAVRWLYVAQIRARLHLATSPGLRPDAEPALYAALNEEVGRPINEWAFGDVDALTARMQEALDWDAAHRNASDRDPPTSGEGRQEARERVRAGLAQLRASVLARKDEIRQKRRAAGLENR